MIPYDDYMFQQGEDELLKKLDQQDQMAAGCFRAVAIIVAFIIAMIVCSFFTSCKSIEYVPIIEHHTDTLIKTNVQRDSVYVHDSVTITQKGDTVLMDRWHTKYVEREVHDTTYVSKIDSIPTPYPVEVKVEKQLTWWQQTRLHLSNILLWLVGILSAYYIIRWIFKDKVIK
jgi:hypothetical protein